MAKYDNLVPRFLKYVRKETRSDEESTTVPSTQNQVEFANELVLELNEIGLSNVRIAQGSSYVFATLPSNLPADTSAKKVGFISHIDTADFNAKNVSPQVVENYDGESEIKLGTSGYSLTPEEFPNLKNYRGDNLITTDGTTLLGADDKAGVTEIMTAVEYLSKHPEIKHGEIEVAFGPDEEIGTGADRFEVDEFGADLAYTVDGGPLGQLEYETFNAAQATIKFVGKDVHPSEAKGIMINALKLAVEFENHLPSAEVPEKTEGRQGFFHLLGINGTVDEAKMTYIIRDHDRAKFEERKQLVKNIVGKMNEQFDEDRVILDMRDQYYNMREKIEPVMHIIDVAFKAMEEAGVTPKVKAIRGGTDGAQLSFKGLPCPNIFAGGLNFHGRYEFVPIQSIEKAMKVVVKIAELVAR